MSENDGRDERAFDDPSYDELRRLLAETRETGPVPADVAARLDATLASLQEERSAPTSVVPLRRRVGRVLVAAAVLVVVGAGGVGIAQVAGDRSGGNADSAGSVAADKEASGSTDQSPLPTEPEVAGKTAGQLPRLTTAEFGRDVAQVMRTTYAALDTGSSQTPQRSGTTDDLAGTPGAALAPAAPPVTASPKALGDNLVSAGPASCAGPEAPDAVIVPARLDGDLVALVFRPPSDDVQVVEAWSCDGATLLASATVPH